MEQIKIGGKSRHIHFGFGAKRRLDPIIQARAKELGMDATNTTTFGLQLFNDIDFIIQLLKIGLEEGQRIADQKTIVENPIDPATICDWMDEDPEAINAAIEIYGNQQVAIMAKRARMEPGEFLAMATSSKESPNGTDLSESPSGGSE